jgi:hypothetical protein
MLNPFIDTLMHLRQSEEVLLFDNKLPIPAESMQDLTRFLAAEYTGESIGYPGQAPPFDEDAAAWSSLTFYKSAQLILFRETGAADLVMLFPDYEKPITPSAIASADLVLRFLPGVVNQLKKIDAEDALIPVLENFLARWHYSAVSYKLSVNELDFEPVIIDPCLFQLYVDRIISHKNITLALHPVFRQRVKAALGIHADIFWKGFKEEEITNYEPH